MDLLSFYEAVAFIGGPLGIDAEQAQILLMAAWTNGDIPWTADETTIRHKMNRVRGWMTSRERRSVAVRQLPVWVARFTESHLLQWVDKQIAAAQQPKPAAPQESEPQPELAPAVKPAPRRQPADCSLETYGQHYKDMLKETGLRPSIKDDEAWAKEQGYRVKGILKARRMFKKKLPQRERAEWKSGPRKLRPCAGN